MTAPRVSKLRSPMISQRLHSPAYKWSVFHPCPNPLDGQDGAAAKQAGNARAVHHCAVMRRAHICLHMHFHASGSPVCSATWLHHAWRDAGPHLLRPCKIMKMLKMCGSPAMVHRLTPCNMHRDPLHVPCLHHHYYSAHSLLHFLHNWRQIVLALNAIMDTGRLSLGLTMSSTHTKGPLRTGEGPLRA